MTAEPMAPGDDAPPGTPGTGEDICPECSGTGKLNDKPCPNCAGTGRIIEGVGGGRFLGPLRRCGCHGGAKLAVHPPA